MGANIGILPNSNDTNVELKEMIGPNSIHISVVVKDYKAFIDSLLEIKEGGRKRFIKYNPKTEIQINIINEDTQDGKKL